MLRLNEIYKINKYLFDKLHNSNYSISKLIIEIYPQLIQINICFESRDELDEFIRLIKNTIKKNIYLCFEKYLDNLTLCLKSKTNNIVDLFEKLLIPKKTKNLKIIVNSANINFDTMNGDKKNLIKLDNLPKDLEKLEIITSSVSFDLSNLPTNLTILCIKNSKCKFNLDHLPNGVKILHLPFNYNMFFSKLECFDVDDIYNLPESIEQIWINESKYCSKNELINIMLNMNKK